MAQSKWLGVVAGMCLPAALFFSGASGQSGTDDAAETARVAGVYEASADTLTALTAQLPKEQYDVAALAATLAGKTPQEIADWAGAHIALIPYRGVLKGAQGALEDQHANSLDRALLIEAVLKAQGVTARLARTTLADDQAEALLAALEGRPPSPPVAALPDERPMMAKFYADPRVDGARRQARDEASLSQAVSALQQTNGQIQAVTARLQEQTAALRAAAETQEAARRRSALADHWWVQVESGGSWVDLDPSASVLGALAASDTYAADQLPEDLKRSVTIRVVAEFSRDGVLKRDTLLARDFDPAQISGRVMLLRHRQLGTPSFQEIAAASEDFDAGVSAAMHDSAAWVPVLVLGEEVFTDRLVAIDGDVSEATAANIAQHGGDGSNGVGDAIGGIAAGIDEIDGEAPAAYEENAGPVKFTAEFVEIETRDPGEAPRLERRALFDAIGPAARARQGAEIAISDAAKTLRGFTLNDTVEIMVTTGRMSPARAESRIYGSFAVAFRSAADWLKAGKSDAVPVPEDYRPANVPLTSFAMGRTVFGGDPASGWIQTDTNAIMTRLGIRPAEGGGVKDVLVFDIVLNRLRAPTVAAAMGAGVADTFAEHIAVGAPNASHNTAVKYAQAVNEGTPWRLIAPGDTAALASLSIDPDSSALVADDLARGYAVVVPERIASLDDAAWWRIDPVTGETLGMNALGGAEFVEYIHVTGFVLVIASCGYKQVKAQNAAAAAGTGIDTGKLIGIAACYAGALIGFAGSLSSMMVAEGVMSAAAGANFGAAATAGGYGMAFIGGMADP